MSLGVCLYVFLLHERQSRHVCPSVYTHACVQYVYTCMYVSISVCLDIDIHTYIHQYNTCFSCGSCSTFLRCPLLNFELWQHGSHHRLYTQTFKILYCIVLYCIVLYCIVLYCIVLYCIVCMCMHACMYDLYVRMYDLYVCMYVCSVCMFCLRIDTLMHAYMI